MAGPGSHPRIQDATLPWARRCLGNPLYMPAIASDCAISGRDFNPQVTVFRRGFLSFSTHRKGLELGNCRCDKHLEKSKKRVLLRRGFLSGSFEASSQVVSHKELPATRLSLCAKSDTRPTHLGACMAHESVAHSKSESPYRTVAHLLLPRQEIELLRQQAAYRNLSFSVWHALAAHRPLGGINRVRRWAYALSSTWRRQQVR